jgi:peptidyl-prolyl cis-trans isomerase SurA
VARFLAGFLAGKKFRAAGVGGAAALGGCLLLSACGTTQFGAAAIVGNQRISQSDLSTQVTNLQNAAKPFGNQVQLPAAQMPAAVLSWLIKFKIQDQSATAASISVTSAQVQEGIVSIEQQAQQQASQYSMSSSGPVLLSSGISPQMLPQAGRWVAQQDAYAEKLNGGKLPTTQAQANTVTAAITKSQCTAAKSLDIKVNPQFGQFSYGTQSGFSVGGTTDVLSAAGGKAPSPAPTSTALAC